MYEIVVSIISWIKGLGKDSGNSEPENKHKKGLEQGK